MYKYENKRIVIFMEPFSGHCGVEVQSGSCDGDTHYTRWHGAQNWKDNFRLAFWEREKMKKKRVSST